MKIFPIAGSLLALTLTATGVRAQNNGPGCPPGTMLAHFDLDGIFDDYPGDITWNIVNTCNGEVVLEGDSGQPFTGDDDDRIQLTFYPFCEDVCLNPYNVYNFTIFDQFGDGLLNGANYTLIWDGNVLVDQSNITNNVTESTIFGTDNGSPCDSMKLQLNATCPQFAFSFGDPHFMTWSGKRFDFHGQCDLVLLQDPDFNNGEGLEIHLRTKARYQYSYIESAAVKIGDDIFEVGSWGQHFLNGVEGIEFPTTMGQFATISHLVNDRKKQQFVVKLDEDHTINIGAFKDLVSVTVDGNRSTFQGSLGLMGSSTGRMMARDGKTLMEDPDAFGQEWQVRDIEAKLFQNMDNFPQFPQKCVMPKTTLEERRRLGETTISEEVATAACKAAGRSSDLVECIYDVMAVGDLEMADAGAF